MSRFCRKQGKTLKINKEAINLFENVENQCDNETTVFDIKTESSTQSDILLVESFSKEKVKGNEVKDKENDANIIEKLNKQIDFLMKENENKNKQIENLNKSLNQVLINLDQQQKLALVDKQRILELEQYKEKEENKTFFQKLFSKKKNSK